MKFIIDALHALILAAFLAGMVIGGVALWRELHKPEPVAVVPDGRVLRRLEIRLHEPLDSATRGDRYRPFECSEVQLNSPRATP